jgi:hypothetical protein
MVIFIIVNSREIKNENIFLNFSHLNTKRVFAGTLIHIFGFKYRKRLVTFLKSYGSNKPGS